VNIIFREAVSSDAAELLTHIKAVGGETDNLSFGKDTFSISVEREAKFIERFHKSKNDIMLIALDGDTVVGNAIVERNRVARYNHRAEISITVLREYWGKGIGSHLMKMMIDFSKKSGIEILYLEARSDNHRAISLYEKFGFDKIGTYKNFFKIQNMYFDADLMMLNLKNPEKNPKKIKKRA